MSGGHPRIGEILASIVSEDGRQLLRAGGYK
ncbi:MAG: hypothetical protein JWN37_575 [Candidatus Nomurabacteria bacterium]|nr:hypothetical protein [Candidatus Nomurabacteria bacterium]